LAKSGLASFFSIDMTSVPKFPSQFQTARFPD